MDRRPLPVTLIGWLYIVVGVVGFAGHITEAMSEPWVEIVRLLAVVAGVSMLRGHNWARWLAVAWIGFHVIVSVFHSWFQLAVHILFFAILTYFLFRPESTRYFRARVKTP